MTKALWRSAFVAALFALHPLHVESVAWVSERKDVLSALFFFLTLLTYATYAEDKAARNMPGSEGRGCRDEKPQVRNSKQIGNLKLKTQSTSLPAPACILRPRSALLYAVPGAVLLRGGPARSKPMLVTLPFVLLLLDYWPLQRLQSGTQHLARSALLPLLWLKIPFFVLSAASCVVTFHVQKRGGAVLSEGLVPLGDRLMNAAVAYATYLGRYVLAASSLSF